MASVSAQIETAALQQIGVDCDKASDIEPVLHESTTNAVQHASQENRYRVRVELSPEILRLQVTDQVDPDVDLEEKSRAHGLPSNNPAEGCSVERQCWRSMFIYVA
jgi:anti-sigma regulatory factor (Ser/Thr protein kinase)